MSTRKLILLALACGLAILLAGGIQLLRIRDNEVNALAEGDSREVARRTVQVVASEARDDGVYVTVRIRLAPDATTAIPDAATGWSLVTGGRDTEAVAEPARGEAVPSCAGLAVEPGAAVDCVLRFGVAPRGGAVVSYMFGDERVATWALSV